MSLAGLMVYRVRILHQSTTDDKYGDAIDSFSPAEEVAAWVEQTDARESLEGGNRVVSDWLAILPVETNVDAQDRIEYDGDTFEIVGKPMVAAAPASGDRHIEVRMRLVTG